MGGPSAMTTSTADNPATPDGIRRKIFRISAPSAVSFLLAGLWIFPLALLAREAAGGGGRGMRWWLEQRAWQLAARTTLEQAVIVAGASLAAGWLLGVLTGLASPGWRRSIQTLCVLPLILPPFPVSYTHLTLPTSDLV